MVPTPLRETLDVIGAAFEYPRRERTHALQHEVARVRDAAPAELADAFARLAEYLEREDPDTAEETYTRLFDLSPVCTLDLGYHVFGEGYERGALLAGLTGELREAGIDPGTEIADFLPTVLRLLGRTDDPENRALLLDLLLLPALGRMATALDERSEPWCDVVRNLPALLERTRTVPSAAPAEPEALAHA